MPLQRLGRAVFYTVLFCVLGSHDNFMAQTQPRRLEVSFDEGNVTIIGENVTLGDILTEWGRTGGSRMVNADKLGGAAIPYIEFRKQPEAVVLQSLLRDVPGYGAALRVAPSPHASSLEAVFILARRTVAVSAGPASTSQQLQQVPRVSQSAADTAVDDNQTRQPPTGTRPPPELPDEVPTPGGSPNLRVGPGGTVTSTIPGVVIPPASSTLPGGRGRAGGGGL